MRAASLLILAALSGPASAQFLTGNQWLERYRSSGTDRIYALGFVAGAIDSSEVCMPVGATLGQAAEIVERALVGLPEMRHLDAAAFVVAATQTAWPCKQPRKPAGRRPEVTL